MRILALDLGDRWTGVAVTDPLCIVASPYKTVETKELISFLADYLDKERVKTIVVGYPITLRGTESDQTRKVKKLFEKLKKRFSDVAWELFDERFTSDQAKSLSRKPTKQEKLKTHARAAAFLLSSYLLSLQSIDI